MSIELQILLQGKAAGIQWRHIDDWGSLMLAQFFGAPCPPRFMFKGLTGHESMAIGVDGLLAAIRAELRAGGQHA